jgi:PIN domain nuclease of toxin-antitoxin system
MILDNWRMRQLQARSGEHGRTVIAAELRRAMGLKAGDPLVVRLGDDGLRIESRGAAARGAQRVARARGEPRAPGLFQMRRAGMRVSEAGDALAVPAPIDEEPGAEVAEALLDDATIGAVDPSEAIAVLGDAGFDPERAGGRIGALGLAVVGCDQRQALRAGALRAATRRPGLSFAVAHACLGLARTLDAPAVTADRRRASRGPDPNIRLIG